MGARRVVLDAEMRLCYLTNYEKLSVPPGLGELCNVLCEHFVNLLNGQKLLRAGDVLRLLS